MEVLLWLATQFDPGKAAYTASYYELLVRGVAHESDEREQCQPTADIGRMTHLKACLLAVPSRSKDD